MDGILNSSLFIGSLLLLASIFLSKSSSKFGLPILVLFLFIGMIAGNEGLGVVQYEDYELTHNLSLIAICVIIFSGGLQTRWEDIKGILTGGVILSSAGIILTTVLIAAFCLQIFELPISEALLIGAILSSTDAAAIFSLFKDKTYQVKSRVKHIVEFESGSNDPMAFFLVSIFLGIYLKENLPLTTYGITFVTNPLFGLAGGFLFFQLFKFANDHLELDFKGLYPALTIGFLFLSYSSVTLIDGNGLLTVFTLGILLGNHKIQHKKDLLTFFDGASWIFQIGLFVLLGILVFPSRLFTVATDASFVALFMLFVARPLTVFLCLHFSQFNKREKLFISWAGVKGATPIVFASLAATTVGDEAHFIFDVVFFSVLISALLQGSTVKLLAKHCDLLQEEQVEFDFPLNTESMEKTNNGIQEYKIQENDFASEKRLADLNFPPGALVLFIKREDRLMIPKGTTVLSVGDKILLVSDNKKDLSQCVNHLKNGPSQEVGLENITS